MVRLTLDLIARGTSGYTKKKRDESVQQYVKRLTHLYLENKNIDDLGEDLTVCRNLTVLYLYDNRIEKIPNLSGNPHLIHLYMQNNLISRMENLNLVSKLTKLYLGHNAISVVEGLDRLDCLQELHVENQRLPPGERLVFDPRSLAALAPTLLVLSIAGNNLDTLRDIDCLRNLQQLFAGDNQLNDFRELASMLSQWRMLTKLELQGNPMCEKPKYRDRVVVMSPSLRTFDGKEIAESQRQFLMNWKASKEQKKQQQQIGVTRHNTIASAAGGMLGSQGSGLSAGGGRTSNISGYIMPGMPRQRFDEVLMKASSSGGGGGTGSRVTSSSRPGLHTKTLEDALEKGALNNTVITLDPTLQHKLERVVKLDTRGLKQHHSNLSSAARGLSSSSHGLSSASHAPGSGDHRSAKPVNIPRATMSGPPVRPSVISMGEPPIRRHEDRVG